MSINTALDHIKYFLSPNSPDSEDVESAPEMIETNLNMKGSIILSKPIVLNQPRGHFCEKLK